MKYHGHVFKKIYEAEVEGGHYFEIYKNDKYIVSAWTLDNAKEFVDSFDGNDYHWNVLC